MVELDVTGTTVTVRVTGAHRFLALRDHVSFDLSQVKSIAPAPVDLRPPWVRAPGTFFPGVIAAGIFRGKGRKEFWDTRFDGRAVRIELAGSDFTRLVVDVEDVQATLRGLSSAIAA
ncbi:hypothetical protein [Nocardia seriolae]|uniref:Bacterial Pleckstrin homology domain-containing protein n=1 Tax=Nocardia seriolae TaxID=37332 RepID=A0A0B8NIJ7_9NOCA|nr:hypothetical protein [Nocardia seriolae]APA99483.1 hypothetical protein NS506_05437 [Nocardia seriolae]MTJ63135.1 hypothetical protein [Nocardia seriolae]MTJ74650.1 hypothetical protein [Nocardia seriolae]MTJ89058.1 hypothetical protein [Nocardia seriolae]MTK33037.1 hypothetical protein [Nocardia seriolae]